MAAPVKIRDYDPGQDGPWVLVMAAVEALGATRAIVQCDDGVCQGYAHPDGRVWAGPLVTPTAAKAAADAAAAAAAANAATLRAACLATVDAYMTALEAIDPSARTANQKWQLAISYLTLRRGTGQ